MKSSTALLLVAAWTLFVWVGRVSILVGPASAGFKAVHAVLILGSLTAGIVTGVIGWRLRKQQK